MAKDGGKCARGRIWVEHVHEGAWEIRIVQTIGVQAPAAASLCLTYEELRQVATMIEGMFPDRAELEFGELPEMDEPSREGYQSAGLINDDA